MLKFFKNKSVGYYLACAAAVLALVFIVVFYTTLGVPGTENTSMPNSAVSKTAETIGIFMIGGFVVELAVLLVPEFAFVQLVALVLFGLSFYKEIICCPQVLAAIVTGVAYEGGSLPAHLTYIILEIAIFVLAIVSCFLGLTKKTEEGTKESET